MISIADMSLTQIPAKKIGLGARDSTGSILIDGELKPKGPPVDGSRAQDEVWRELCAIQQRLIHGRMTDAYTEARAKFKIFERRVPRLCALSEALHGYARWTVVPAEHFVGLQKFLPALRRRMFPCTQGLRGENDFFYARYPDLFHDCIGHLPMLCIPSYRRLYALLARIAISASCEQLLIIDKIYRATAEAGLVRERGRTRVYGASYASGVGDLKLVDSMHIRRFAIGDIIERPVNGQTIHRGGEVYIVPSVEWAMDRIARWAEGERLL